MLKYRTIGKNMTESQWVRAVETRPKKLLASNGKLAKANIHQFSIPAAAARWLVPV